MARFEHGRLLATPGVLDAVAAEDLAPYLVRHARGDWGTVDAAGQRANERALVEGTRLLSAFVLANGVKVWINTEADRAATTILLPEEY